MSADPSSRAPSDALSEPPLLTVHGRSLSWGGLILSATALLVVMTAVSVAGAWWAWHHLAAQVTLSEQQADIRLPDQLQVQASVERQVKVKVDQVIPVRVPIHQTLNLPIHDTLPVEVTLDTTVPVNVDVPVKQMLKVDQLIHVDTQVHTKVMGIPMTLPIQGDIPVMADVPVDMLIPIRHQLPLALLTQATVKLEAPLKADIDTVIEAQVPFKQTLSLPVSAPVGAMLRFPDQHVKAGLNLMTLTVPFQSVRILPRGAGEAARVQPATPPALDAVSASTSQPPTTHGATAPAAR